MQHVKGHVPVGTGKTKREQAQQDLRERILAQGSSQGRLKGNTVRRKDVRQHVFISGQRPPHHADVVKRNPPLVHQGQDLFGHHVNLVVRAGNRDKTTERNCGLWIVDCGSGLSGRIEQVSKRRRGLDLVFDRSRGEPPDVLIEELLGEAKGRMLIE